MTSNFSINHVFEPVLDINFTINNGVFTTYGQTYILQHATSIQNLNTLTNWEHTVLNTDNNNYLEVEYRWSFDSTTWTTWITMLPDFINFPNPNTSNNIWIQIKYKYITTDNLKQPELKELNIYGTRIIPEIFQSTTIAPGSSVVYTNQDTYKVFSLEDYNVYLQSGSESDLAISFRYTQTQGRIWSPWVPLTAANLQKTKVERLKFCNFQFAFQNNGTTDIKLYDLELTGEFQNVTANYKTIAKLGLKTQCNPLATTSSPCSCDETTTTEVSCIPCSEAITPWNANVDNCELNCSDFVQLNDKNLWASQIQLYAQLTDFVTSVNSWKCTYVLTDPDGKGIDHVLHEQQIHNMISMKDINIIIPDNQFPVDNISFSGLDLDLIQSFEIHITKEAFKNAFGVEFRPSKRDIVYVCDVNQLWEVEQMFPKRGFMNAETYYRVLMKKYNDRKSRQPANTQQGQDAKSFIDSITKHTTLDNLFDIDVDNEVKQNTKDLAINVDNPSQQHTERTIMTIRKSLHNKVFIGNDEIWNASVNVAKTNYIMPIKSKNLKLVEYNYTDKKVGLADNRALSLWFKTEEYDPTYDWTIFSNYDSANSKGYKLNIYQGAMTFTFNGLTYSIPVSNMQTNVWYCILINMDQIQRKLELSIYTRQSEDGASLANNQLILFNKMIFDITPSEFEHNEEMFIGGCDIFSTLNNTKKWYLTNLRLWNQVVGKTERQIVLNEYKVSDANLTIFVDNAEPAFDLPEFGNF